MNFRKLKLILHAYLLRLKGRANSGWCPVCSCKTTFVEYGTWLRDNYLCIKCHSIPRNRALIHTLTSYFPEYRSLKIHESSPSGAASAKIASDCPGYVPTQLFTEIPPGSYQSGVRCQNLECMTFPDDSFDLIITQDVFEHVMHPDRAFADIARTLKPGGAHIFTVPLYPRKQTMIRAIESEGTIKHLAEPQYHGNPVDEKGSLVIREWGEDIVDYIRQSCGMTTSVYKLQDRKLGIDGEFLEIFISRKPLISFPPITSTALLT